MYQASTNPIDTEADQAGEPAMPPVPATGHPTKRHEARLQRILDHQMSALKKPDSLEANLGSINSSLMRFALWLDESIEQKMESGPATIERVQEILPAIETQLRVTRQVDRYAQLELRIAERRDPKPTQKDTRKLPVKKSSGTSDQSEDPDI